jgi:hypothetical protein
MMMNLINYATLEQSKRMKELGYPQDKTDCVWFTIGERDGDLILGLRDYLDFSEFAQSPITEWYAAPNAQEIELQAGYLGRFHPSDFWKIINVENCHCAQARASAWIWERENAPKRKEIDK